MAPTQPHSTKNRATALDRTSDLRNRRTTVQPFSDELVLHYSPDIWYMMSFYVAKMRIPYFKNVRDTTLSNGTLRPWSLYFINMHRTSAVLKGGYNTICSLWAYGAAYINSALERCKKIPCGAFRWTWQIRASSRTCPWGMERARDEGVHIHTFST